jgi:hypothetical protein
MDNLHPVNLGVRNVALSEVWSHQPAIICCSEGNATSNCWLFHYSHVKYYFYHLGRYGGWLRTDGPGFEAQ